MDWFYRLAVLSCVATWACYASGAWAASAEILQIVGRGEYKLPSATAWLGASVRQPLDSGTFVRTGDVSQMALLLIDLTQLRLNQNSILQLRQISHQGQPTQIELSAGRAWMQAKGRPPKSANTANAAPTTRLEVRTPNAIAAIRGTDWDIEVIPGGNVTLTVLSGEVAFYNDFGSVVVLPNEQAVAESGKAPVKRVLVNARERVQWVGAHRPQPRRWVPQPSATLAGIVGAIERQEYGQALKMLADDDTDSVLLRADIFLFQGEFAESIGLLERLWQRQDAPPRVAALLAKVYLLSDMAAKADTLISAALARYPDDTELWLAKAEIARLEGNASFTQSALERALASGDGIAEVWYARGRAASEREFVEDARLSLHRAIDLAPEGLGYRGELATLETFADNLSAADDVFAKALDDQPADYVALTGLGVLRLKQGRPQEALETLLKAGAIEPRYARSALYTGIAYYQLGQHDVAIETLRRAAQLDGKDPLPNMMLSHIAIDRMAYGEAVAAAHRASELMPYLKSLNQLANDQKGTANIGTALARFGMEEWAQALAYQSYSPYWAGSHLFLADRYLDEYAKNSELYQGFLSDPTAFGASNRHSTLIPRPGTYFDLGTYAENYNIDTSSSLKGSVNGQIMEPFPLAYYVDAVDNRYRPGSKDFYGDLQSNTVGFGMRPTHELGFFLFSSDVTISSREDTGTPSVTILDNDGRLRIRRADLGAHYKFSPVSQIWWKIGQGKLDDDIQMEASTDFQGMSLLSTSSYRYLTDTNDWHVRHVLDLSDRWQLGWGVERGYQDDANTFRGMAGGYDASLDVFFTSTNLQNESNRFESQDFHLTNRYKFNETLTLVADLSWQSFKQDYGRTDRTAMTLLQWPDFPLENDSTTVLGRRFEEWNPRLGLIWRPDSTHTVRFASQNWRRPATASTLTSVDTAGIPIDDRLVGMGGKLERQRLQYEAELGKSSFAQIWFGHQKIENLPAPDGSLIDAFSVPALKRLLNKGVSINDAFDDLEALPSFGSGRIQSLGVAANQLLAADWSLGLRYLNRDGENKGQLYSGNAVPWVPRHVANASLHWLPVPHLQVAVKATWRSQRFADEANTKSLDPGWALGLHSYMETVDKRGYFEVWLENLHADKVSSANPSMAGLRVGYRF